MTEPQDAVTNLDMPTPPLPPRMFEASFAHGASSVGTCCGFLGTPHPRKTKILTLPLHTAMSLRVQGTESVWATFFSQKWLFSPAIEFFCLFYVSVYYLSSFLPISFELFTFPLFDLHCLDMVGSHPNVAASLTCSTPTTPLRRLQGFLLLSQGL